MAARSGRAGARQASVSLQCTIDAAAGEKSLAGRALHGIYRKSEIGACSRNRLFLGLLTPTPDAAGPRLIEGRIDRDTTQHRPCRVTRPARQRPETAPTGTTQRLAWTPSSSPHTQLHNAPPDPMDSTALRAALASCRAHQSNVEASIAANLARHSRGGPGSGDTELDARVTELRALLLPASSTTSSTSSSSSSSSSPFPPPLTHLRTAESIPTFVQPRVLWNIFTLAVP